MEYGVGDGVGGSGGGDHHDSSGKKKRYHRHTALQIQLLESTFKECPHPDENIRMQLSRELGLAPRQIKFWFQNRRTQMKALHERADNFTLRAENDKIRWENIAIREALKNVICPTCGGPPAPEDSYFDEQKLRFENAQLKEELDRVSSIAAKYIGRPLSQLPPVQPVYQSPLDLSMATYGGTAAAAPRTMMMMMNNAPSLDLDLLTGGTGGSSGTNHLDPPYHGCVHLTDMDRTLIAEVSSHAMDEIIKLLQADGPFWAKSAAADGREVFDLESYERVFPGTMKNPNVWVEASRASAVVMMNNLQLVDMFLDSAKWVDLFPTCVSRARTIEEISSGLLGCQSGSLQLMYEEMQVLSPLVSTRQFYFLRSCREVEQGCWAVADVSYDPPQDNVFAHSKPRRLPSGCLIQDMPNGYSKVTWVEHVEIEEKTPIHRLYTDLIHSGLAFGAERWLACLQRSCERIACLMVTTSSTRVLGGVIPSPEGKRSMMKLAKRMVHNFCASFNPCNGHQWTSLSGANNDFEVRATLHKSTDPAQPNGMVLSAATTIWLPVPPDNLFDFFQDERTRPQWDVLSNRNPVQEIAHIAMGSRPGNCISLLRAHDTSQNNMLILQESCTDASGSLVVYCPVDLPSINVAMSGEDPSYIPLLPSGFSITADGRHGGGGGTPTTPPSTASLLTLVFQILVSSLSSAKMSPESISTVNNLIGTTVHHIKSAFNCPSATT